MTNVDFKKDLAGIKYYFLIAVLFSWLIFIVTDAWLLPGALAHQRNQSALLIATFGHLAGMFGPALAAIILWKHFYRTNLPPLRWSLPKYYIYASLAMAGLWVIPAVGGLLFGDSFKIIPEMSKTHWIFVGMILSVGWFAGTAEELGWCSFVLSRLSPHIGGTRSVIISGVLRGVWHWPILAGPIIYKTVTGNNPVYLLLIMGIVYLVQLVISNILFGSVFGYLWYKTKSYPLLGWTHIWFDLGRDFSLLFIFGYQGSFWSKFGWGLLFYPVAYFFLDRIARQEGITNLNKVLFSNWLHFLSRESNVNTMNDSSE